MLSGRGKYNTVGGVRVDNWCHIASGFLARNSKRRESGGKDGTFIALVLADWTRKQMTVHHQPRQVIVLPLVVALQ